jgi:outer membrane protein TolC
MNLSMSYGRERRDELFDRLWVDPDNSYTLTVSAFLPVWDWGERKARIASGEIGIQRYQLQMEETKLRIVSEARNEVLNVRDRESRTFAMRENLELARGVKESGFERYEAGAITALDLLLGIRREADTAENFLDAYLSWKGSLVRLQRDTFFSFDRGQPVLEWFQGEGWMPEDGLPGADGSRGPGPRP